MPTDELKQKLALLLSQVDERDLRAFAKLHGITIPADAVKKEVIEILCDSPPTGIDSFLNAAIRLELRSTELSILEAIETRVASAKEHLEKLANESTEAMEQSIRAATNSTEKSIEAATAGIGGLKTLFTTVGAALSLMLAVGGLASYLRFSQLDQEIEKAKKVREELTSLQDQSEKAFGIYRRYMVSQWINAMEEVMETFSSSLPDARLLKKVSEFRKGIDQMAALTVSEKDAVERKVIARIQALCDGLAAIENLKHAGRDAYEVADRARNAEERWLRMQVEDPAQFGEYAEFIKKSNAFRGNALGVIAIGRYKRHRGAEDLNVAYNYFDEAVTRDPTFGRGYGNQAVVYYYWFQAAKDIETQKRLIGTATALLKKSMEYPERSGDGRSRTLNGIASYLLLEAFLLSKEGQAEEAKSKLAEAQETIARAEDQEACAPIVYVTRAEIESMRLYLEVHSGGSPNSDNAAKIVEFVRRAVGRNYRFEGKRGDLPFFGMIESVYPEITKAVYATLGVS